MGGFADQLRSFRVKTEERARQIIVKVVFDVYGGWIVKPSPVDTGRFKANNQISINSLPAGSTLDVDKSGSATISTGGQVIQAFQLGDTIFFYNNVEYALNLEYGSSKQAPGGVYRIAFQQLKTELDRVARALQ